MLDFTNNDTADPVGDQQLRIPNRKLLTTSYSIAIWLRRVRAIAAHIFAEYSQPTNEGWLLWIHGAGQLCMRHHDGTGLTDSGLSNVLNIDTLYLMVFTWDGTDYQWWLDNGVASGNGAFVRQIQNSNLEMILGANVGAQAFPGMMGHPLLWPDVVLAQSNVQTLFAGVEIPYIEDVRYWHRGLAIPGLEEYEQEVPTQNGNIWLKELEPPDNYYTSVEIPREGGADPDKLALVAQELQRDRNAKRGHMVTVPLAWLGREIIDDVQLISASGLEPTGDGFGMSDLALPRLQRIMGMKLSPTNRKVGLTMRDMHHAVMLYDQLVLPYKISTERFGAFELYPAGASKATTRASKVYVHQIGTLVTRLSNDVEPITREGELIETERTNEFKNPSFVAGVDTDWTPLNEGVNGSDVADDTVDLLFESGISTKSCKIKAGSPLGGAPVGIEQDITLAATAPSADVPRIISIDKKDDSGYPLSIKIQRDSDNWYRTSLSADNWGAPETYLDLPVDRDMTRYLDIAPILPGVHAGIVYTVGLYAKASAGQINHLYHVQWEKGKYATSRMVSGGGATYTRTPSIVRISNYLGARTVYKPRGSIYLRVVPEWAPAERDFDANLLYVYHSAANYFRVYYDHGSGELRAHWYDGSNHYSVIDSADVAWSAYDELKIGFRWMSAGDLEATAPEFQLFADFGAGWVTGTKGTLSAWLDESDASYIQIGAKGDTPITTAADAYIKYLKSIPEPLLLDYFKALP